MPVGDDLDSCTDVGKTIQLWRGLFLGQASLDL